MDLRKKALLLNLTACPGLGHIWYFKKRFKGFVFALLFILAFIDLLSVVHKQITEQSKKFANKRSVVKIGLVLDNTIQFFYKSEKIQNAFYTLVFFYLLPCLDLLFLWKTLAFEQDKLPSDSPTPKPATREDIKDEIEKLQHKQDALKEKLKVLED
ncbi:hypothetical protein ACFL35_21320 [Candidatus Riflebacteria bacterium]